MKWLRSLWHRWRHRQEIREAVADVENRYLALEAKRATLLQQMIDDDCGPRSLGQHFQPQSPLHRG